VTNQLTNESRDPKILKQTRFLSFTNATINGSQLGTFPLGGNQSRPISHI